MWKVWIDTGGTFTDCIGMDFGQSIKRLKVLSNSSLRGVIRHVINKTSFYIDQNWPIQKDILQNYQLRVLGEKNSHWVSAFDPKESILTLDGEITLKEGTTFELFSGEEVPVLAARLLTQTPLNEPLPELEMRLGSTRGTNALLERKGDKVLLLVSRGFKDLLLIGDQQRPHLFELNIQKHQPFFHEVIEVNERMDATGNPIIPLTDEEIEKINQRVIDSGMESVAISLMHSYLNPEHELRLGERLKKSGIKYISTSSLLSPSIKILQRTETAVVNAYLDKTISMYIQGILQGIGNNSLEIMTSSGGLSDSKSFTAKDSLLSGPAGGVVGCANTAKQAGVEKVLSLDIGGTSADVSHYNNGFDYQFETHTGEAKILSPSIAIETIAAGGGSVCNFDGHILTVGPESAGAYPGPACYGAGGPLSLTDVNILLGKIDPNTFQIPISREKSLEALHALIEKIKGATGNTYTQEELLFSFLQIANEKMAEAIRKISVQKGHDPKEYALMAFGGGGGQHGCQIAEMLGIQKILIPYDAGLLSAKGIGLAELEAFHEKQVLQPLENMIENLPVFFEEIGESALQKLPKAEKRYIKKRFAYLRFRGQENTIEIAFTSEVDLYGEFKAAYSSLYGHWVEGHPIEVESLKVIAAIRNTLPDEKVPEDERYIPASSYSHRSFTQGAWEDTPIYKWEELHPGAHMQGPAILVSENSTVYLEKGWDCSLDKDNTAHLTQVRKMNFSENIAPEEARLELFTNRFKSIAEEMGAVLQRTSFSVNVKERLDFSCAVLDDAGELVVNAPHIPVHLGSLGLCVRKSVKEVHAIDGDVIITNHPAFGGSHLPDISLIAPVYYEGERVAYIANRAHHAEIGGTKPGSMPADATRLIEEGVVIRPTYLMKEGKVNWEEVKDLFTGAKYPSRAYEENIADLKGALASVMRGKELIQKLCAKYGVEEVKRYMKGLKTYANNLLTEKLSSIGDKTYRAEEWLDNEAKLSASITMKDQFITFDFSGTSPRQSGNLNATESIVHSVVLYVLRLLINKELPLNEGLMSSVKIILPDCFLSPDFTLDNEKDPAVVGGNTEISQRLTDTLLKALELAACSQGTMNNLLFGDDTFGYYETICGGTGAGQGFDGADAVHQHMTNTKITDPEIMEFRYPVVLNEFSIRTGSGGKGKWSGGNGVVRDITFLKPVELTILAQHRKVQPYGMHGGQPGSVGVQYALLQSGEKVPLSGSENIRLNAGDRFVINTPGGGGYSEE